MSVFITAVDSPRRGYNSVSEEKENIKKMFEFESKTMLFSSKAVGGQVNNRVQIKAGRTKDPFISNIWLYSHTLDH